MSKRGVQIVILVEDKQQRTFVMRLLQELGFDRRKLNPQPLAGGEQYVRQQYPLEVRELRRRSHHMQLALVVVIDADQREVSECQRQLAEHLKVAGLDARGADERIIHLIPRYNIETWIAYLLGQPVNETEKYPRLKGRERDCQPAVEQFVKLFRSNQSLPPDCPASLVAAIHELRRLG